jgi:hypothetical protein
VSEGVAEGSTEGFTMRYLYVVAAVRQKEAQMRSGFVTGCL